MGERLCELEEKLRKSEQQRQKLRDNLVSRCHLQQNNYACSAAQLFDCVFVAGNEWGDATCAEILQGEGNQHARAPATACRAAGRGGEEGL